MYGAEFGLAPGFVLHFQLFGFGRLVLALQIVCIRLSQLRFTLGLGIRARSRCDLAPLARDVADLGDDMRRSFRDRESREGRTGLQLNLLYIYD